MKHIIPYLDCHELKSNIILLLAINFAEKPERNLKSYEALDWMERSLKTRKYQFVISPKCHEKCNEQTIENSVTGLFGTRSVQRLHVAVKTCAEKTISLNTGHRKSVIMSLF